MADDDRWRELVPQEHRDLEALREIYTGGGAGQLFTVIFLLDESNRAEPPSWKELVSRIVGKFFLEGSGKEKSGSRRRSGAIRIHFHIIHFGYVKHSESALLKKPADGSLQ